MSIKPNPYFHYIGTFIRKLHNKNEKKLSIKQLLRNQTIKCKVDDGQFD